MRGWHQHVEGERGEGVLFLAWYIFARQAWVAEVVSGIAYEQDIWDAKAWADFQSRRRTTQGVGGYDCRSVYT